MTTAMTTTDPPTPPPITAAWLVDDGCSELMLRVVVNIISHIKGLRSDLHVQYSVHTWTILF